LTLLITYIATNVELTKSSRQAYQSDKRKCVSRNGINGFNLKDGRLDETIITLAQIAQLDSEK